MQPHIRIVVAPNHPVVLSALASLQIQGMIDIPMPTRQLLGFMSKLITAPDDLPHVLMPNADDLQRVEETTPETNTAPQAQPTPEAQALFERLAAEEPPMPTFEDAATVADVVENFIKLAEEEKIALLEAKEPDAPTTPSSEPASSLAAQILEAALDTSTPVHAVLNRVKETITNEDLEPSDNREPDFLKALPSVPLDDTASKTGSLDEEATTDRNSLSTKRLEPILRSRPPIEGDFPSLNELRPEPAPSAVVDDKLLFDRSAPLASRSSLLDEDHEIAQLALTLTEMSVEMAAEAAILVRRGEIVAYSGRLPRAEVETLADYFKRPWNEELTTVIDFVRLEAASADYVLYGVRTQGGFILYLLFVGSMPISAIRRQSRVLMQALEASTSSALRADEAELKASAIDEPVTADDEDNSAIEEASEAETSELVPYNFVWLLRDTTNPLTVDHAQQLVNALHTTLRQRTWRVRALDVYSDFVYLRADLPPNQGASRAVREAMRASAELLQPTTPTWAKNLWSDSYLVVPSDRELSLDEIRGFIQFARS
jgi:REP element-mobilizing transposase RayT